MMIDDDGQKSGNAFSGNIRMCNDNEFRINGFPGFLSMFPYFFNFVSEKSNLRGKARTLAGY
jgi:hypothetical protein